MNKKIMMKSKRGFTMVEMAIVIIMIGILTASLAPLLLRQHTNSQEGIDHQALLDAQTAVINYAISFGGIPNPVGLLASAVNGGMPNVPAFGVNNWGAYGSTTPFQMDVNGNLTSYAVTASGVGPASSVGGDRVIFCQAVNDQLKNGAASLPQVCQDYTTNHTAGSCAAAFPVAFVLYSTGNDRTANQGNVSGHIYENDKRGINNSPGTDFYDDQVMSYSMTALARDCREKMGVAPEVMNCPAGQKYVGSITNNLPASSVAYSFNAATPSSSVPANFTLYDNSCHLRADILFVSGVPVTTPAPGTLDVLDANKDGRVDIYISASGVTFAVTTQ